LISITIKSISPNNLNSTKVFTIFTQAFSQAKAVNLFNFFLLISSLFSKTDLTNKFLITTILKKTIKNKKTQRGKPGTRSYRKR